ncbi:MAG: hypothetical protein C0506_10720 [Anaerolinea sp.]|nr:hypothetical protein [Anaerolinea sp.]
MARPLTEQSIPLAVRLTPREAPVIRARWLFAMWMAVGALVAVLAGLVLGILAALETSIGGERWTPSVQAHGRLQLFGFVATFVVALAMEFIPRLNQRPMFPARVRVAVPAMLGSGALLLSAAQVFEPEVGFLALPGGVVLGAGAVAFVAAATRARGPRPLRLDPQPLFIQAAAGWLAVAAALSLWAMAKSEAGVVPLEHSRAVVEVFLRGFVMLAIMGVGLRAFVGHLGLEPLSSRRQLVVLVALNGSLAAWLLAQGLGPLPEAELLWRAADVVLAGTLLMFTVWLGMLRRLTPRWPPKGVRYELLIPVAWTGLVVYAVMLMAAAVVPGLDDLSLYQEGGIRHVYLLGFVVPLMVAMAHVVLARFGTGRVEWENALTTAFVLVWLAWPLRVVPALFDQASLDAGRWLFALAGVLAMAGLGLVAAVCLRTALVMVRPGRA